MPLPAIQKFKGVLVDQDLVAIPKTVVSVAAPTATDGRSYKKIGEFHTNDIGEFKLRIHEKYFLDQKELEVTFIPIEPKKFPNQGETTFIRRNIKLQKDESPDLQEVSIDINYKPEEKTSLAYIADLFAKAIPNTIRTALHEIKRKLHIDCHTIDEAVLKHGDDKPLTDKEFSNFFINGVCPLHVQPTKDGLLKGTISWEGISFDKDADGQEIVDGLPSATIYFKENENKRKLPIIDSITIQYKGRDAKTYQNPAKDPNYPALAKEQKDAADRLFLKAKTEAACAGFVYGQTVYHLLLGHVLPMAHRDLMLAYLNPDGPIAKLVLPFTHFLRTITNTFGKTAISGEKGILGQSCLNEEGINQLMAIVSGAIDPFTAHPRTEREFDKCSRFMALHRKVIQHAVSQYLNKHWEEIEKNWGEVHTFFDALFKKSPAYQPFQGETNLEAWLDASDLEDEKIAAPKREEHNGILRAIRHIAKDPHKPLPGDRELMENYFSWFITQVTGWHSYIHLSQINDPRSFPIRLGKFGGEENATEEEKQYFGLTKETVDNVLGIGNTLLSFPFENYALINNPNKDIDDLFVSAVKKHAQAYGNVGFNVNHIMLSTVI